MATREPRLTNHEPPRRRRHLLGLPVTCVVPHFLLLAAILLAAGCTTVPRERAEPAPGASTVMEEVDSLAFLAWQPPSFERNYRFGPDDVVEITIFQLLELNTSTTVTARISEEGYVALPILGNVMAQGLTTRELEREIASLLEEGFLVDPQVSVLVKEYRSRSVLVFGAVARPGIYRIRKNESTILDVLSQSGGATERAGDWLYVLRNRKEETASPRQSATEGKSEMANVPETETIQIDLRRLLQTGDQTLNIAIKHGDVINLPPAEQGYFFASGAVVKPGIYPLRREISVLQGLAVVGGLARRANPRNVQIIRGCGTPDEERITVNVAKLAQGKRDKDVFLQPGDLLVVSRQPLAGVGDFFERIFSFGVGATYNLAQ